jgi:PUA-domain protein
MGELRVRKRHRLRQKEIRQLAGSIRAAMGTECFDESDTVDMAELPGLEVVYVGGTVVAMVSEGEPFLTIRGIMRYGATKRYVTVDMGAVRFVANGADIMGPGVVDADPGISEGEMVWVRDENHKRPLAIGRAMASGQEMASKPKGKVIKSLHFVGDKLWSLDEDT